MALLDERQIHTDVDSVIEGVTTVIRDLDLHAIKFGSAGYTVSDEPWDGGPYEKFWEAVSTLGVPVFFTLSTGPARTSEALPDAYGRENYIGELQILSRLMERYPDMLCSITHGFPWRVYLDGDHIALPNEIWEPFENPEPEPRSVLPRPHRRYF